MLGNPGDHVLLRNIQVGLFPTWDLTDWPIRVTHVVDKLLSAASLNHDGNHAIKNDLFKVRQQSACSL